jgi:hypothetical protein
MASKTKLVIFLSVFLCCIPSVMAQQKGQWVPGQAGLTGGALPNPGFTVANLTINYSAGSFKDSNGNSVPVTGSYDVWAVENIFEFVPKSKVLGGQFMMMATLSAANGSLTVPVFGFNAGGYGFGDVWIQPVTLGWNFKRVDTYVGYGFVAPTGRYVAGATDNIGSGYWGHHLTTGTTLYLTKNRLTSANLTTDWEIHGRKEGSNITPGQAFTLEWGLGHIFHDKQFKKLLQLGVVGYDQWQVSTNSGTIAPLIPASLSPYYSVHAIGFQTSFIVPAKNLSFFFKYEPEYLAKAHTQGRTIAFGAAWTLRMPKPQPPRQP